MTLFLEAGELAIRPLLEHIDQLDTYYFKGEPTPMGYTFEGRAVSR